MIDPRDLYGLPLDRFVPERGALAKALRVDGRRDEAARVAELRKPSVAAWTVNQLVRTQGRAVGALFEAGDELQRAQADLLGGQRAAPALHEAAKLERQAVEDLAKVARGLLSSEGHEPTPATLDRVSETLHAAALDEDARAQVQNACLERELRRVGFGGAGAVSAPPSTGRGGSRSPGGSAPSTKTTSAPGRKPKAVEPERAEQERAKRVRGERRAAAREAEAAARRDAELAARDLKLAQERRERAAGSLREAEEALAAARERTEEAGLVHQRAREALERV